MQNAKTVLPQIVTADTWATELEKLLAAEKKLTRARDAVNAQRRKLPMVKIEKDYTLLGNEGPVTLHNLFEGRRQLIIYHFMYAPDAEAGCPGCSWMVDAMPHPAHLHARDTTLAMVSRAPLEKLRQYRQRMGWNVPVPWYSSGNSDFNYDLGATTDEGEIHGISVFIQNDDAIYRTYYSGDRGVEYLGSFWSYLDLTPFGRQENWEDSPPGWPQGEPYGWINRHDEYEG